MESNNDAAIDCECDVTFEDDGNEMNDVTMEDGGLDMDMVYDSPPSSSLEEHPPAHVIEAFVQPAAVVDPFAQETPSKCVYECV